MFKLHALTLFAALGLIACKGKDPTPAVSSEAPPTAVPKPVELGSAASPDASAAAAADREQGAAGSAATAPVAWPTDPAGQTRALLDGLIAGDPETLASAPLGKPLVVKLSVGKKTRTLSFADGGRFAACVAGKCAESGDALQQGAWQVTDPNGEPAAISCAKGDDGKRTRCTVDAVSLSDHALLVTAAHFDGGTLTELHIRNEEER